MDADSFETWFKSAEVFAVYRKDPVPPGVIEEIIEITGGARVHSMNTQPWYFHVLTGAPLT